MITIKLTNEEAQQLAALLDIAVKSGGIQVAAPALALLEKVRQGAEDSPQESNTQ
jgi:hypothetical protein